MIKLLEQIYPSCLEALKTKHVLSASTNLIECFDHVLAVTSTAVSKQECYERLHGELLSIKYVHDPNDDECIVRFLKTPEFIREDIDSLGLSGVAIGIG